MAPAGRRRTGFAACWRRTASSSARCSAVRSGLIGGFMASLRRLRDIVCGDRANDKRIGRVQHLEDHGNKPARGGAAKGNGTTGRVAHVERRVVVEECGFDLF